AVGVAFVAALIAALVWWLFRETDWRAVGEAISRANWCWIGVSVAGVLVTFVTRIQRWSYIVRTAKPVSFRHMFSATQIGFLGNFVLPARAGEAVRALALGRLANLHFSRALAFVALDRVTDLFGLMAVILVAAVAFRPAHDIRLPPSIYAGVIPADLVSTYAVRVALFIMLIVGAFVLLYVRQRLVLGLSDAVLGAVSQRLAARVHEMLQHFADGLHVFRSARDMAKSLFFSLFTWAVFVLTYAAVGMAFGLDLPWYAPFVVVSFLALAISVPGAPGFIGQFHFGVAIPVLLLMPSVTATYAFGECAGHAVAGFTSLYVGPAAAALGEIPRAAAEHSLATAKGLGLAVAIVAHLINVFPVFAVGLFCLYREQLGLFQLRREAEEAEAPETAE
ncbi:MAG TPA: lysylphosphatidylglycerol synthase transmembrane domain-containing protein, partial [Candidatus Hydrogenedentes bacterium]|nr:lysylphosphatidylglycerol synthase transmembrane domain-containing protein [Candidatus Hydrogenedentota bacterium]